MAKGTKKKLELVFIPLTGFGHLTSTVEFAKRLLDADARFSVTIFLIYAPNDPTIDTYINVITASDSRIKYTHIPYNFFPAPDFFSKPLAIEKLGFTFIESHKPQVEQAISDILQDDSVQLAGLVVDMVTCGMIDVADKFNVPAYTFFTSSAAFLGFQIYLRLRHDQPGLDRVFKPSDPDSVISTYENPVPVYTFPDAVFDEEGGGYETFLYLGTRIGQGSKGVIVNTFSEIEPYAVNSFETTHSVYPIGPLLNHDIQNESSDAGEQIMSWLDEQPPSSVLYLCFGSLGSFHKPQLEQIAIALDKSGHRFLWSIRQPPKSTHETPSDYSNPEEVLPDWFLANMKERGTGFVCSWSPQVKVLAHGAVKGFVSHCGWNSILESLWYGVPIATWPLYSEQRLNAFMLVKELGLGVELSLDYKSGSDQLVMVDQIEKGINNLMDDKNPVRERVKELSEKSKKALENGGSSFVSLRKLIDDMVENIAEKV